MACVSTTPKYATVAYCNIVPLLGGSTCDNDYFFLFFITLAISGGKRMQCNGLASVRPSLSSA